MIAIQIDIMANEEMSDYGDIEKGYQQNSAINMILGVGVIILLLEF